MPDHGWTILTVGMLACLVVGCALLVRAVIVMYMDTQRRERDMVAALRLLSGSLRDLPRE